jgi:cyclic beta-1,2-glucan synthetase
MWGRTALYQSSGADGFRDQLQDSMAFVYAEPGVARERPRRGASIRRGDVCWWHPESGRGMRTRFSDDLAWPPTSSITMHASPAMRRCSTKSCHT